MSKGVPTDEMLRRILQGEMPKTRIGGFQLRLNKIKGDEVHLSLLLVDKNGTTLVEYGDTDFVIKGIGSTLTVCDLDRMFDFRLAK
jgi:hypothetical protein